MSELLRGILFFWRCPRRWQCHGNIWCCQHIDRPNDNNEKYLQG